MKLNDDISIVTFYIDVLTRRVKFVYLLWPRIYVEYESYITIGGST